ncbi:MAG: ATP-binding protein [Ruminococcus sp.]|nr:ATP-binding protein [Ruminococcus sp.]
MPKVIMTIGRICSGKSSYAKAMAKRINAVIFSVDEITLKLLGQSGSGRLDEYVKKLKEYFFQKTLQTLNNGVNVILDWGFWTREERDFARSFFKDAGAEYEFHFINITDDEWQRRVAKRNEDIFAGKVQDYLVDNGLAEKADALFETAAADEKDVIFTEE